MSAYSEALARVDERFVTATNNPRKPTERDRQVIDELLQDVRIVATRIERDLPNGRLKSLALTHLEETLTWANKAIYLQGALLEAPE